MNQTHVKWVSNKPVKNQAKTGTQTLCQAPCPLPDCVPYIISKTKYLKQYRVRII